MITDYRPWVTAVGNDDTNAYSFPFKITKLSEIVVVQIDVSVDPPTIDFVERGDVGLNVQSVDFDSVLGGGTITFTSNLPAGKRIYIKIANDEPTQPSRFRDQQDFKLKSIEDALDFIVNQATRLSDKAERSMRFADPFTHVESVVNLEIQTFPVAYGMPIMSSDAIQLEMKPILLILEEQGVLQLITDAQTTADQANTRLDALEPRVATAETDIDNLEGQISQIETDVQGALNAAQQAAVDAAAAQVSAGNAEDAADAAAASAAAAVGASVSNRIQVIPYAPAFMGALLEEEYDQEVYKFDIGNRVKAPAKMSAYFIPGAPIKLGFTGYSPTADSTSKYNVRVKATLVKDGEEVTSTVNEFTIDAETTVGAVVSAAKAFSFIISADGTINLVAVAANDLIILEITRIDASGNEDMNLLRLYKQTFELSFA